MELVPANCLIGSHETIPGLVNDTIPSEKGGVIPVPQMFGKQTIFLHNLSI